MFSVLTLAVVFLSNGCSNREPPRPSAGESAKEPFDWNREMSGVADGSLKKIAAASYAVTPEEFRLLARGCDSLEGLEIDNSKLDAAALAEVLASLPGLKVLKLTGPVGDDELRAIAALPLPLVKRRNGLAQPGHRYFGVDRRALDAEVVLLGLCAVMCPEIEIAGTLEQRRVMGVKPE